MSQPSTQSLRELIAKLRRDAEFCLKEANDEWSKGQGRYRIEIEYRWKGQAFAKKSDADELEALLPSLESAVAQARVDVFCTIARDVQNQFDAADGGPTETRVALASVLHLIAARRTVVERDLAAIAKEPK